MIILCFIGIMVSTGALALIAAIMMGFQQETIRTLQGLSPDIVIKAPHNQFINAQKIRSAIDTKFPNMVIAYNSCSFHHVLLQHPQEKQDLSHVIALASIDPHNTQQVLPFAFSKTCNTHVHAITDLIPGTILIGSALAHELNVTCGDSITIRYLAQEDESDEFVFATAHAKIVGIYHSGIEEWDLRTACIAFDYAQDLFNDGKLIQQIQIKLAPGISLSSFQKTLAKHLHLPVLSWYDLNPALVSALTLEKIAMLCIFALIMLISCITTMALLCLQLIHHQKTIAVLAAYGMPHIQIQKTFVIFSTLITGGATILGLIGATIISCLMNRYQLIRLPDIYYSSYVPAEMSFAILLSVTIAALIISALAAWYPARRIRHMPIARILSDV